MPIVVMGWSTTAGWAVDEWLENVSPKVCFPCLKATLCFQQHHKCSRDSLEVDSTTKVQNVGQWQVTTWSVLVGLSEWFVNFFLYIKMQHNVSWLILGDPKHQLIPGDVADDVSQHVCWNSSEQLCCGMEGLYGQHHFWKLKGSKERTYVGLCCSSLKIWTVSVLLEAHKNWASALKDKELMLTYL